MSDEIQADSPTVETTTEQPAAAPVVTETPKETFDQTLDRVAREIETGVARGTDGKFQSRVAAPGAPQTTEVPGSPQAAPPDPAPQVIEAPQSLPADVKAKWASLPPEHQQWLAKREGEIHQKLTTDGERLKSLGAFEEVLKPLDARLKQLGAPPQEYVRRLAAADQLLATDGIRGIQQIAQMYGIDLRAALQAPPPAQQFPTQPDIQTQIQQGVQQALQGQRVEENTKKIEAFRGALSADEQPDFDRLESLMVGIAAANPKATLEDLYKAARRADPDTLAKDTAKAKVEADEKAAKDAKERQEKDAKLAQLGKRPGSAPTAPIKGKDIWDTMDRVGKDIRARG